MSKHAGERPQRFPPLALRPDGAAEALGISKSTLEKLVKEGKIRPPVSIRPGISLYDFAQLAADWAALRDECLNGSKNEWDQE
ncbi:MAG: hypothetical protein WBX25_29340 [Rhodomicrobium sp.]